MEKRSTSFGRRKLSISSRARERTLPLVIPLLRNHPSTILKSRAGRRPLHGRTVPTTNETISTDRAFTVQRARKYRLYGHTDLLT